MIYRFLRSVLFDEPAAIKLLKAHIAWCDALVCACEPLPDTLLTPCLVPPLPIGVVRGSLGRQNASTPHRKHAVGECAWESCALCAGWARWRVIYCTQRSAIVGVDGVLSRHSSLAVHGLSPACAELCVCVCAAPSRSCPNRTIGADQWFTLDRATFFLPFVHSKTANKCLSVSLSRRPSQRGATTSKK